MELTKFKKVLENFLNPTFEIKNDCYLETLFGHIKTIHADGQYPNDFNAQCHDWISKSLGQWEAPTPPIPQIATFTLKLIAMLASHESDFLQLQQAGVFDNVRVAFEKHPKILTPSIKLAHINVLRAATQHASGLQWIKTTKQWKITYYQDSHTVYVMRAAHDFVYTAMMKFTALPNCDDELCVEILKYFMAILLEHPWSNPENIVVVDDADIKRKNLPMLNLICYILDKCIESQKRSRIVFHILITLKFEVNLWKLAEMSHDQQFLGHVLRAFVFSNFARFSSMDIPATADADDLPLEKFVLNFYNYMNFCIQRRSSRNIIMMAEINHMLWKKLGDRAPVELMASHKIKFGDQVLLLQLLPIIYVIKSRKATDREYLDEFSMKMFKISCEFTIRLMYSFRDLLRANADNVADLACKSIQGILAMRESLSRERAIIVFQALVYIMKEFTPDICEAGEKAAVDLALLNEIPNLLSAILTGLYELIKIYRLTWNECLETTALVNFMLAFLNNPNLSTRLSVQALKLTQLSIEHYLVPNLALLLDTLQGSGMENLGPMIVKRLHDLCWETRDSTLELLCSMTEISEINFPAFQQHILDNGICPIVVSMAQNDNEPYVRASALKCLTVMTKIDLFWDKCLVVPDIANIILTLLANEDEGVVRREAVTTLKAVFVKKDIDTSQSCRVFSMMAHCATNDLYWEVKVNALIFWKNVICKQFLRQGMVDGQFPNVIFCKFQKKIVTLNEKEILLRIQKVLVALSACGCLGVLLTTLNDDSDLEVVKVSVRVIQKFLACLKKYHFLEQHAKVKNDLDKGGFVHSSANVKLPSQSPIVPNGMDVEASNAVIESIVNSDDINLLSEKYKRDMSLNGGTSSHSSADVPSQFDEPVVSKLDDGFFKHFAKVTVDEFLSTVTSVDLDEVVEKRTNWLSHTESFESLLDDILTSFPESDVNDADCY